MLTLVLTIILLALIFDFLNGFHDAANSIATIVSTRVLTPRQAVAWAAFFNLVAALLFDVHIAKTVGKGLIDISTVNEYVIMAGLIGAIAWNLITWYYGIPSSSSHALIGGVVGAGIAAYGTVAISWNYIWLKVVLMVLLTPLVSFLVGYCILLLLRFLTKTASLRANVFFTYAQWFNMAFLAFNHSFNDSQKSIGIVMILIRICGGAYNGIPVWAAALAAVSLACGIAFGGFKIIKTVGTGIYKVQPIDSFASQMTAGTVLLVSSLLGAPVSSSQIVSSSIMGVGAAERYKAVKWNVAGRILVSWVATIPVAGLLGALLFYLFRLIF
jgi:PiT family inorganic phosphate transporter